MSDKPASAQITKRGARPRDVLATVDRVAVILACAAVFYPGLNPGLISSAISRNVSLFTASISYGSLVSNVQRALMNGQLSSGIFVMLEIMSLVLIIGIVLAAAGGCMSVGNRAMQLKGFKYSIIGGIVMVAGLAGIFIDALNLAAAGSSSAPAEIPGSYVYYVVLTVLILVSTVAMIVRFKKSDEPIEDKAEISESYKLFLMFLPIIALAFVFSYLPLWGWRYAFFDYTAGGTLTMDNFVGLKWFTILFQNETTRADVLRVLENTLAMSGLGIITSWIPMAFAIFLTQAPSKRFRRFVQTWTTVPNFLGWVIVYAIALAIFSTDGFINNFINNYLGGGGSATTNFLMSDSHMWLKMLLWGLWKGVGWSAIIYISSISGIDLALYEAAEMDGAGRWAKIKNVTIPQLMPTFFVLLLMSIANVLSNGMDQYLVFSNAINSKSLEVLDLYVYNLGIGSGQIPMSTAIGMFKSVISVILLFGANAVSKKLRGISII
jgi:putative aldouronate transport system permease protein